MKTIFFIGYTVRDIVGLLPEDIASPPEEAITAHRMEDFMVGFGGKAANAAIHCAKTDSGVTHYIGTVGTDFEQMGYDRYLTAQSVKIDHVFRVDRTTPVFLVLNAPEKQHIFHLPYLYNPDENKRFLSHTESTLQAQSPDLIYVALGNNTMIQRTLKQAKASGSQTAWNPFFHTKTKPDFVACLPYTDILFLNEIEAATMTERLNVDITQIQATFGVKVICVTMGERGCQVVEGESVTIVPAPKATQEVDPTGAGDAFAGTFLSHAIADGFISYADCAQHANQAAAKVVAQLGAHLPTTT